MTATRGRPVSIASVGYSFIGLLRAGNFQFDYKLPPNATRQSALPALLRVSAFPRSPLRPPPPPPHPPSTLRPLATSCSSGPPTPHPLCVPLFLARGPMKKLSSLDRDGIIGRPTLFMAFIFLEIAAGVQTVRHSSPPSPFLSLVSFLASFSPR